MSPTDLAWFGLVTLFFSRQTFRPKVVRHQGAAERLIGSVLMTLGATLAFTGIH